MGHRDTFLGLLPPQWCEAIRANRMGVIRDQPAPPRTDDGPDDEEPDDLLHSADLRALIARLRRERLRRGLSLGDVSRETDQSRSALSRLENGHYCNPRFNTVYRYAQALGLRIVLSAEPLPTRSDMDGGRMQTCEPLAGATPPQPGVRRGRCPADGRPPRSSRKAPARPAPARPRPAPPEPGDDRTRRSAAPRNARIAGMPSRRP